MKAMSITQHLNDDRLTRDEARQRAELIELSHYEIELDLSQAMTLDLPTYPVTTTLRFTATTPGSDTFLNYLGDTVDAVTVNGVAQDVAEITGTARILIRNVATDNEVVIHSQSRYSHSGEGLHRFVDPVDGQVYLYSQFEPADARRVYPNMEQPDLKARFHISMIGPDSWILASNGVETSREPAGVGLVKVRFAPTHPVSTYLTTFLAGPYAQFDSSWDHPTKDNADPIALRIFARQSLAEHVDAEELFQLTRQGLSWFHEQFHYPYPWGKYDQAFVPEYNLGAMENPGLVTFNESYIFTSQATSSQHLARATTLMHEMSHMWFGDLVTMKWWDDLWLKESFADFFGTKAVADATQLPGAWQSFAHQRKAWAYVQDSYPTTHPIVADIVDLEAARQNFDGITYAKGAAVIKQLFHYVGEDSFLAACRTYFSRFAFSTAQLNDFLAVLEEASGRNVHDWAPAWLQTSGPASLETRIADNGSVTIRQSGTDPQTGEVVLRPHTLFVAVLTLNENDQLVVTDQVPVEIPSGRASVVVEQLTVEDSRPRVVLINHHDQTYAQVQLDPASLEAVLTYPVIDPDSTAVATVWSSLWTMVRQASLPAADFVTAVARLSESINDVSVHSRVLSQAVTALKEFAPTAQRTQLTKLLSNALLHAIAVLEPGSDRQRSAARALTQLGMGSEQLAPELTLLLASHESSESSAGLRIDDEMRWLLLISLASTARINRTRLDNELAASHTATNELFYRTAIAALPDTEQRMALWQQVLRGQDERGERLTNAQLTATADGLLSSAPEFGAERLQSLLESLLMIWNSRSNNLASRTINGLFPLQHQPVPGGPAAQAKHPVLVTIDAWLAQYLKAPAALRRIVIERRADIALRLIAQAAH